MYGGDCIGILLVYCTVYCTVLYCTVLYEYCNIQYCKSVYCTVLYCTVRTTKDNAESWVQGLRLTH